MISDKCKYIGRCPDVKRLGEGLPRKEFEDLSNQYLELCLSGTSYNCLTYKEFEKNQGILEERIN